MPIWDPVEDMYLDFCENYVSDKNEIVCLFHVTSHLFPADSILKASKYLQRLRFGPIS